MIELKSGEHKEYEHVPIFSLDGTTYSISTKPRANVALRYLKILRNEGQEMAQAYMLEQLLPPDAYEALTNYDELTEDVLKAVMEKCQEVLLGARERAGQGNS